MPCPTCDHTLQRLSLTPPWHWCPRCGTVAEIHPGRADVEAPKLVERCRRFEEKSLSLPTGERIEAWKIIGIAESIRPPGRPVNGGAA